MKIILDTPIVRKDITHQEPVFFMIDLKKQEGTVRFNFEPEDEDLVTSKEPSIDFSLFTREELESIESALVRVATLSGRNLIKQDQKI